jgi:hypothetical protein
MSYYASIGQGASNKVMANFPNLRPVMKPRYNMTIRDLSKFILSDYFSIHCFLKLIVLLLDLKNLSIIE